MYIQLCHDNNITDTYLFRSDSMCLFLTVTFHVEGYVILRRKCNKEMHLDITIVLINTHANAYRLYYYLSKLIWEVIKPQKMSVQ